MRKFIMFILCLTLFTACTSKEDELTISDAFGEYSFKELYYVAILNKTVPDAIETSMLASPYIMIEEEQFIFQDHTLYNIEYVEDEFNKEEEQLYFKKKYKVIENGADTYYRVYLTYKNVFVGVYYNTVSMRYIIKVA